jgi:hypothetical protein
VLCSIEELPFGLAGGNEKLAFKADFKQDFKPDLIDAKMEL